MQNEVDNLEKVLLLLENQAAIFQQDNAIQQQMTEKTEKELRQLEKEVKSFDRAQFENKKAHYGLVQVKLEQQQIDESLQKLTTQRKKLHNQVEDLKGNIRVFVRVRPQTRSEAGANKNFFDSFQIVDE